MATHRRPQTLLLPLLLLAGRAQPAMAVRAPNTSLATIPAAYFGGHHNEPTAFHGNTSCPAGGCRPAANIQVGPDWLGARRHLTPLSPGGKLAVEDVIDSIAANAQILAKMRLIMVEKWEGHCCDPPPPPPKHTHTCTAR